MKTLENCIGCGRFINPNKSDTLTVFDGGTKYLHERCQDRFGAAFSKPMPTTRYGILKLTIRDLRDRGYSYNRIQRELGCARSTISYHCGQGQKEKTRLRKLKNKNKIDSCGLESRHSLVSII